MSVIRDHVAMQFRLPSARVMMCSLLLAPLALVGWQSSGAAPSAPVRDAKLQAALAYPRTFVLVRHAEKGTDSPQDPALSEAGVARARELARHLEHAGVTHIFTSEFRRTRETAAPLAIKTGIVATTAAAKDLPALESALQSLPRNSLALVVGHSNTVPGLVKLLAGKSGEKVDLTLNETDYDRLFVVTQWGEGQASLLSLRY